MRRALVVAAALLALAGCKKSSGSASLRLNEPTGIALFHGYSHKHADTLWPYMAVANTGEDELILFDPVENEPVSAPILIRPLSVPVSEPRPAQAAAAAFPLASGAVARPDLLVVVSAGSTELQLVRTWKSSSYVDPGLAAGSGGVQTTVELGGQVQSIVATPKVDGTGAPVPDRAWVIAALTDQRLAVVEFAWNGDPAADESAGAGVSVVGAATVQSLGFDALSLAVDPREQTHLYAATMDLIGGTVQGVAQLDLTGTVGAWSIAALDAHAPTRLVAAFTLKERNLDRTGTYDQITDVSDSLAATDPAAMFQSTAVHRVYAALDPGSCGPERELPCGVAVLDPSTGDLLENPWNPGATPTDYLRPMALPSTPVALQVGAPPANAPSDETQAYEADPYMLIRAAGERITTGVLMVPCVDGYVYYLDLARWEAPSSSYEVASEGTYAAVSSFTASTTSSKRIGFWTSEGKVDPTSTATSAITVTPGFTGAETWALTFQGYLPNFSVARPAQVESAGGELLRVALQSPGTDAVAYTQVVHVFDPKYGVRPDDIVELYTTQAQNTSGTVCPDTSASTDSDVIYPIEGKIVSVDAPDATHPGGSLVLQLGDCVPRIKGSTTVCDADERGPQTRYFPNCWGALPGTSLAVRIRAGGGSDGAEQFVVVGSTVGYVGRATASTTAPSAPTFSLSNDDEALASSCPSAVLSWPEDYTQVAAAGCDAACRALCERVAVARKARRHHLTSVVCSSSDTSCQGRYGGAFVAPSADGVAFPPPSGPAVAFSAGLVANGTKLLVRDQVVKFVTRNGFSANRRYGGGATGGVATDPRGLACFDRTADLTWGKRGDGLRCFVTYVGDMVLDVSPSQGNSDTEVLR